MPRRDRRDHAAPRLASGVRRSPPLVLYRCPGRRAWITVSTCEALQTRTEAPQDPRYPLVHRLELSPCTSCHGVTALREQRKTPAPRELAT